MKYFSVFLLVHIFGLVGCTDLSKEKPSVKEIPIEAKIMQVDSLIGRPFSLQCLDSYLLVGDLYDGKAITVIDTRTDRFLGRTLTLGAGPGEVMGALRISYNEEKSELSVYQIQNGTLHIYAIQPKGSIQDLLTHKESLHFQDRPFNVVIGNDNMLSIGVFDKGRFHIYDTEGNYLMPAGDYPFDGNNMRPDIRFALYQGQLCSQPNGSNFVLGGSFSDELEFYTIQNGNLSLIKSYGSKDVLARVEETIKFDDNCLIGYKGVYGTSQYCYLLYSGKTYGENADRRTWAKSIHVYNWNGDFVKSYQMNVEVLAFCVDEKNGVIYGISKHDGEFVLVKFTLP